MSSEMIAPPKPKAHDEREPQQVRHVQAIGREVAVHAKQARHHAEHRHEGDVGEQEQHDTFHVKGSRRASKGP